MKSFKKMDHERILESPNTVKSFAEVAFMFVQGSRHLIAALDGMPSPKRPLTAQEIGAIPHLTMKVSRRYRCTRKHLRTAFPDKDRCPALPKFLWPGFIIIRLVISKTISSRSRMFVRTIS